LRGEHDVNAEPRYRAATDSISSGIEGLDDVLHGGLTPGRTYLIEGSPGSGKTTLATQFLIEGLRHNEPCMFVTLSESEEELHATALSHDWSLAGLNFVELLPDETNLDPDTQYRMYHASEVELGETIKTVIDEAERVQPRRVVIDSVSELRLLAGNALRYRRQIIALKQFFARQAATVLFTDDRTGDGGDAHLHSLAHGVISMEREVPPYGTTRRRLHVGKMRARSYREGLHDFMIRRGGLVVFPRLVAAEHRAFHERETLKSGLDALDLLLGGGLARGTATLMMGSAGTGKSSLAAQFVQAAARRGDHCSMFIFDESIATFLERSAGLGMEFAPLMDSGRVLLRQVDPAELSPGEFAHSVREAVEQQHSRLIVIDSLNGYLNAMPSETFLTLHLHELLGYLGQREVTSLLLMTQHGIVSSDASTPVDASYLADTVVLLRYFEVLGEIRQALSVIKKRTGNHERTIRELRFSKGIHVGEPLRNFHGVLTGTPHLVANGEAPPQRVSL
jgi:circadian clock protein KaiC